MEKKNPGVFICSDIDQQGFFMKKCVSFRKELAGTDVA